MHHIDLSDELNYITLDKSQRGKNLIVWYKTCLQIFRESENPCPDFYDCRDMMEVQKQTSGWKIHNKDQIKFKNWVEFRVSIQFYKPKKPPQTPSSLIAGWQRVTLFTWKLKLTKGLMKIWCLGSDIICSDRALVTEIPNSSNRITKLNKH